MLFSLSHTRESYFILCNWAGLTDCKCLKQLPACWNGLIEQDSSKYYSLTWHKTLLDNKLNKRAVQFQSRPELLQRKQKKGNRIQQRMTCSSALSSFHSQLRIFLWQPSGKMQNNTIKSRQLEENNSKVCSTINSGKKVFVFCYLPWKNKKDL